MDITESVLQESTPDSTNEITHYTSETHDNFPMHFCQIIGYATNISVIPALIIGGLCINNSLFEWMNLSSEPNTIFAPIAPIIVWLVFCIIFGACFALAADLLKTTRRFYALWVLGVVSIIASLCIPFDLAKILLFSFAYSISRSFWHIHLISKLLQQKTLIISAVICAVFLLLVPLMNLSISHYCPYILCLLSLCFLGGTLKDAFKDWVFVPKEAMRGHIITIRLVSPLIARVLTGMGFCGLMLLCSSSSGFIYSGFAWLVSALIMILVLTQFKNSISKTARRALFTLGNAYCLIIIPCLPKQAQILFLTILIAISISNSLLISIGHLSAEKDADISDSFLMGFHHASNSLGLLIGIVCSFLAFAVFQSDKSVFLIFGFTACTIMTVGLYAVGVFGKKRTRKSSNQTPDSWHEKVVQLAAAAHLTPRQTEVFDALSRGRNAKYISQRLFLAEGTVKKQCFQIYKALGVHTQQDLITLVMSYDLQQGKIEENNNNTNP